MAPRTFGAPPRAGPATSVVNGATMRIALVSVACIVLVVLFMRQSSFLESMLAPETKKSTHQVFPVGELRTPLPLPTDELSTNSSETSSELQGSVSGEDETQEGEEEGSEPPPMPLPSTSAQPSSSAAATVSPLAKLPVKKDTQKGKAKGNKVARPLMPTRSPTVSPAPLFPVLPHNEVLPRSCETCVAGQSIYRHIHNPAAIHNLTFANFTCPTILPNMYFYSIVECLSPLSGLMGHLLQSGRTQHVHVYLHDFIARFWPPFHDAFQRANVSYQIIRQDSVYPYVANATDYVDRFEFVRTMPTGRYVMNVCKGCFRDLMYQSENLPAQNTCDSVVLVSRKDTRAIIDEDALMAQLQVVATPYNIPVLWFHGNESVSTMVHMFADACVVVGYHGAGETNAIFSRNNTLVVEIDTYKLPHDYTQVWRTNQPAVTGRMGGITLLWNTYMITYAHLRPPVDTSVFYNASVPVKERRRDWDNYIKAKSAYLGPEHIANVSAIVAAHLSFMFQNA